MASIAFLRQILSGQKRLLALDQVRVVGEVERYAELEIGSLLQYARDHLPECLEYLPDNLDNSKIDRVYLMTVRYNYG